ncbi:MAG: carbon-nitrogen hydrolase [Bacteroidales bacterium]|nr:carbon-nitrogen hydrolase [Bacteroidales bacterium]
MNFREELTIGLVQQHNTASLEANRRRSEAGIRDCVARGAQVVALSELHGSLYFCQTEDVRQFELAEPVPGPSTQFFGALAAELQVVLVCSLFERRAAGLYHNTAVVFDRDGRIAGKYRKMHIPDDPAFYEKFYFTPGDLGYTPVPTSAGNIGVLVCWDQWFPEAARLMAMNGADLLLYPTAIGWDMTEPADERRRQLDAWHTIQRAHAIANGIPVAAINRVGMEAAPAETDGSGIHFWGGSFVCGQQGEMLAEAPTDAEQNIVVTVDLARTETVRRIWPFFRDRRADSYAALTQKFGK